MQNTNSHQLENLIRNIIASTAHSMPECWPNKGTANRSLVRLKNETQYKFVRILCVCVLRLNSSQKHNMILIGFWNWFIHAHDHKHWYTSELGNDWVQWDLPQNPMNKLIKFDWWRVVSIHWQISSWKFYGFFIINLRSENLHYPRADCCNFKYFCCLPFTLNKTLYRHQLNKQTILIPLNKFVSLCAKARLLWSCYAAFLMTFVASWRFVHSFIFIQTASSDHHLFIYFACIHRIHIRSFISQLQRNNCIKYARLVRSPFFLSTRILWVFPSQTIRIARTEHCAPTAS